MVFTILSILAVVSFLYCCDIPAIHGFEILINRKDSLVYVIGSGIIVSYIFHIIQVVIPNKINEKRAYEAIENKITDYLKKLTWLKAFYEDVCISDKYKKTIIKSKYLRYKENNILSKYILKINIDAYIKSIKQLEMEISSSGYFIQLNQKQRQSLQKLFDNRFVVELEKDISLPKKYVNIELITELKKYQKYLRLAKKIFKNSYEIQFFIYDDCNKIREFESKLPDDLPENILGLWHMRIED